MSEPLLQVRGLTVSYGGVKANRDIDLAVPAGGIVGLIGPNGAGKTTFVDAVTGFVEPQAGSVFFDGRDITAMAADKRAQLGLRRTFQAAELFEDLSVADNLSIAAASPRWWHWLFDLAHPRRSGAGGRSVADALARAGVGGLAGAIAADLSHGQKKLVGVARAIAGRPKLLVLDEPAAGLDTDESHALGDRLRALAGGGLAIFLIDHDMDLVLGICDYVYVLDFGELIASGPPSQVRRDPDVLRAYLGVDQAL